MYVVTTDLLLLTMIMTKDRPVLSSKRAPHMDKTLITKQEEISGHELQMGLATKAD
jgi:hypothetical protein